MLEDIIYMEELCERVMYMEEDWCSLVVEDRYREADILWEGIAALPGVRQ